ncbi:MAG: cobalt ECF transporter T component CbiQ [Thermodesulfovibrionia bacterium]|nr:cobalt ECF transporter T component CbiQ [Thermodesulfovibrionia bacterium]
MEIFSEHFNKDNFLSKIDVKVKLLVVLSLLVMVLSCTKIFFPILIAMGCFLLCLKMKIAPRVLLLRMAQPLFFALVILLLKLFFSGKDTMFSISLPTSDFSLLTLTGHRDGLIEGLKITSRILGGVSLVMAFGFATPFAEILAGLSWLRLPKQFIEITMFAYRYIFMFLEDAHTIYNAQKNRLGYSGMRKGMKSFGTLAGSLVIRGFDQSQKTSEAMIQRGYTGDMPMIDGRPLRFGEVFFAAIFVFFAGAVWMI